MPAFELVDDRHAVYRDTAAWSLIADNAWNAGIVLGEAKPLSAIPPLEDLAGSLDIAGKPRLEGKADRPLEALAWIANLTARLGVGPPPRHGGDDRQPDPDQAHRRRRNGPVPGPRAGRGAPPGGLTPQRPSSTGI